jgi:Zn-dependent peptidase ImmA (M78 family)
MLALEQIDERAEATLEKAGWSGVGPVDPIAVAAALGIRVYEAPMKNDDIEGILARSDGELYILINQNRSSVRKRFTVAHEVAHFVLHGQDQGQGDFEKVDDFESMYRLAVSASVRGEEAEREREANRFAAALLMPAGLLKREWDASTQPGRLAARLGVSQQALEIRLEELRKLGKLSAA